MQDRRDNCTLNRRRFIKASSQIALGYLVLSPLNAIALPFSQQKLTFFHTHTGEELTIGHTPGKWTSTTQEQVNFFLRDFRTDEIHSIDAALLDTLYCIQKAVKGRGVFEVISGYRSPKTNQYLRNSSHGVAKKSFHMLGQAIDVRLKGLPTHKLRNIALNLKRGGVGYYAKSDFVHLDTGHFRTW